MLRATDSLNEKHHFQMDRFAQQNGEWFYVTREGDERGPFDTRDDAEGDIAVYIRYMGELQKFGQ